MKNTTCLTFLVLFFAGYFISVTAIAQQAAIDSISKKPSKKYFELSLGQTILFISNSQIEEINIKESVVVPTNAALFFAELRPVKKIKIPVFLSLPTGSKQFIVNGELINERASPTFGTGVEFRCFKFPINEKAKVEMELGPLASFLLNKTGVVRFAPVLAGRVKFIKNEDFVIYIGSSYSVGINAFGILFGTGYVF